MGALISGNRRRWLRKNAMLLATLSGVICGFVLGLILRAVEPSKELQAIIKLPGELFMNMLKALILPLIMSSLISGLSQLDGKASGKVGSYAFMYYAITMVHAVVLGIIIVMIIHPGHPSIKSGVQLDKAEETYVDPLYKFLDLIRNFFPPNLVQTTFEQQSTVWHKVLNGTEVVGYEPKLDYVKGMNVLGMIVFCCVFGIVIGKVGKQARPLALFFSALDAVITKMVMIVMWYGAIGIPSLIAGKIVEVPDLLHTAQMLGVFMLTVILGLAIQCFITLPLIYFLFTRKNPYKFLLGLSQAVLTALATSSSAATLPITFKCLNGLGVDNRITKFVLPVGTMINMDGTALYEAVASIFIAQMNDKQMSIGEIITVSITATLASIGAASIPSAGLVTMLIILTSLGLPAEDISLIFAIDWFLDRLRTSVNVMGDALGCGVVESLCQDQLDDMDFAQAHAKRDSNDDDVIHSKLGHGIDFDKLEADAIEEKYVERV